MLLDFVSTIVQQGYRIPNVLCFVPILVSLTLHSTLALFKDLFTQTTYPRTKLSIFYVWGAHVEGPPTH
jgi:hypothetical protein